MTAPLGDNGIRFPRWAVAALTAMLTLIGFGVVIGGRLEGQANQNMTVNYRLCRIERALHVDPWETCQLPDPRGTGLQNGASQ